MTDTSNETQENNNKQTKKRKNKFLALNCVFGSVMLLGCVGTIVFGTLWCQQRKATPEPTPTPVPQEMITVTFGDLKGGTIKGLTGNTMSVLPNTTYGMLPSPIKDGFEFNGWIVNEALQNPTNPILTNCTVTPDWIPHQDPIGQVIEIPYSSESESFILNIPSGATKGSHYALMMDVSKIPAASKSGDLAYVYLTVGIGEIGSVNPLVLQHKAQFLVDNNLVPAASYSFINKFFGEEPNLYYLADEGTPPLPGFDKNTSKLYLDITIDEDTTENVVILGGVNFNNP